MSREIDALVAEKVMGLRVYRYLHTVVLVDADDNITGEVLHYSTDIAAAWTICEYLNRAEASQRVWVRFHEAMQAPTLWGLTSSEAARFICEHALEALNVELPE